MALNLCNYLNVRSVMLLQHCIVGIDCICCQVNRYENFPVDSDCGKCFSGCRGLIGKVVSSRFVTLVGWIVDSSVAVCNCCSKSDFSSVYLRSRKCFIATLCLEEGIDPISSHFPRHTRRICLVLYLRYKVANLAAICDDSKWSK